MQKILPDLKLLATGAACGALACAASVSHPASHICGAIGFVAAVAALILRVFE